MVNFQLPSGLGCSFNSQVGYRDQLGLGDKVAKIFGMAAAHLSHAEHSDSELGGQLFLTFLSALSKLK